MWTFARSIALLLPLLVSVPALEALEILPSPEVGIRGEDSSIADVNWTDPSMTWSLETSWNLVEWGHLDASGFERPAAGQFRFTQPAEGGQCFFRLRQIGSPRLYVVGDSISIVGTWTTLFSQQTGRHTFTQAVGGTTSPSMVDRSRGVQLLYPRGGVDPIAVGPVKIRWVRHVADRTQWAPFRSDWKYCPKTVSEPDAIEVYKAGRFVGLAKHDTKGFTTSHAQSPKTIFCEGHGLKNGDRVTFLSNDPDYPSDLSAQDSGSKWNFSSPSIPPAIIERRVYWAANVAPDSFELRELVEDADTLDLGGDASGSPVIEIGWSYDVTYSGGPWDITWKPRTKYDDNIWLLEVSANDFPVYSAATVTIPNTVLLLQQMTEINPRFLILCPPSSSNPERGPGSFNWTNYYDTYMPWVRANHPDNHVDIMAIMDSLRTAKEKSLLADPTVPELLWIKGDPAVESSWRASRESTEGASQMWVGPGFTPLQFRGAFSDGIHLSPAGNQLISQTIAARLSGKGW